MKLSQVLKLTTAVAATAFVSSASAGLVVVDAWKWSTPFGGTTSNIGHLNVTNLPTLVEQQVNGAFQPFVGAKFSETGGVGSLSYTLNTAIGAGDASANTPFGNLEEFKFSFGNMQGKVTSLGPGQQVNYKFDNAPNGTIMLNGGAGVFTGTYPVNYFTGTANGGEGKTGVAGIAGGSAGLSVLNVDVTGIANGWQVFLQDGTDITAGLLAGAYVFQATTTNTIGQVFTPGACSFDNTLTCLSFTVVTDGQVRLMKVVPEPGSLALVGLSLLGLGAVARRRARKQ